MWGLVKFVMALGVIFLIFYWIAGENSKREIQVGTPEYVDHIEGLIEECVSSRMAENLQRSRNELPLLPTRKEVEAACRAAVKQVDRLYPRPQRP